MTPHPAPHLQKPLIGIGAKLFGGIGVWDCARTHSSTTGAGAWCAQVAVCVVWRRSRDQVSVCHECHVSQMSWDTMLQIMGQVGK